MRRKTRTSPAAPVNDGNLTAPAFTDLDANAPSDTAHGYYYAVTAVDSEGRESAPSRPDRDICVPTGAGGRVTGPKTLEARTSEAPRLRRSLKAIFYVAAVRPTTYSITISSYSM